MALSESYWPPQQQVQTLPPRYPLGVGGSPLTALHIRSLRDGDIANPRMDIESAGFGPSMILLFREALPKPLRTIKRAVGSELTPFIPNTKTATSEFSLIAFLVAVFAEGVFG